MQKLTQDKHLAIQNMTPQKKLQTLANNQVENV